MYVRPRWRSLGAHELEAVEGEQDSQVVHKNIETFAVKT